VTESGGAGATLGVEEEFHLIDPETLELVNRPALAARASEQAAGAHLQAEMLTSQLEAATEPCSELDELRAAVIGGRNEAQAAANGAGAGILATSTHPFARLDQIEIMDRPRYGRLVDRFGAIVHQFNLCGLHVHVSVPDLDAAVAIMNHVRLYLPALLALNGSSPFHEGQDTGYESFRTAWLALWPQGGTPPFLHSAAHYLQVVEQVSEAGLIDDASTLLWELRPSMRYPTLEFRVADMCPDVDDVILFAALCRSLVRTMAARVEQGAPAPEPADAVLRAARWRAARYGFGEQLWSPERSVLAPGEAVIAELFAAVSADLRLHGEHEFVAALLDQVRTRGTSAVRQRRVFAETGSLKRVAADSVALTLAN
jgi:glutamate---cysteine ligase / carboxylate-amine ligase